MAKRFVDPNKATPVLGKKLSYIIDPTSEAILDPIKVTAEFQPNPLQGRRDDR